VELPRFRGQLSAEATLREQLAVVETRIERAVDLAIETGGIAAAKKRIAALEADQARLTLELQRAAEPPDLSGIHERVRARVEDLQLAFAGAPEGVRAALGALLAGQRLTVHRDDERGFRVDGMLQLPIAEELRHPTGIRALDCVVAGGRYARVCAPIRVALPVLGSVSLAP
jgi:hypothetical protein